MGKPIICLGDMLVFLPDLNGMTFVPPIQPVPIPCSGIATVGGKTMCVDGDFGTIPVINVSFTTPLGLPTIGTGVLSFIRPTASTTVFSPQGKGVITETQWNFMFILNAPTLLKTQQPDPAALANATCMGIATVVPSNLMVTAT